MKNSFSRARLLMVFLSMLFALLPLGTRASDQIQWKTLGPGGGGNMVSAAVSPLDPNTILMGSDVGGIFKSINGGLTWQMRNNAFVGPTRPGVYGAVGFTWDTGPGRTNIVYQGTFKSTDEGDTWQEKVFPRVSKWIGAIDPTDHTIVYLAGYLTESIIRSECAFETCPVQESFLPGPDCTPACGSPVPGGGIDQTCCFDELTVHALVVNPADHTQVLACTPWGLYQSDTSQNPWTWSKVSTSGLPETYDRDECNDLVIQPTTHVMYMTLATHRDIDASGPLIDTWKGGVYKSVEPCGSWGSCWQAVNGTDGTNLLSNPSFETLAPPYPAPQWSSADSNVTQVCNDPVTPAKDGACAIKIDFDGDDSGGSILSPVFPIQDGVTYRVSGWANVDYSVCIGSNQLPFQGATYYFEDSAGTIPVVWAPYPITWSNIWGDPILQHGWRYFETRIRPLDRASFVRFWLSASCGTGSVGTTWIDKVELTPVAGLPGIGKLPPVGGINGEEQFVNYLHVVVDSQNDQVAYVGTGPNRARGINSSQSNFQRADTAGIWKTEDGGATWRLTTNTSYRDNVLDGITNAPICGNGICEGRGEDCSTCQADCTPGLSYCCGNRKPTPPNNVCETAAGENVFNCLVDCPENEDPTRPYYDAGLSGYEALSLAIGSGPTGHETLYFGLEHYVTHDGGSQWTETSSDWTAGPPPDPPTPLIPPIGSWKARGDTNDVVTLPVLTWPSALPPDPALEMRLFYGDQDNFLQASFDKGFSFSQMGRGEWDHLQSSCTPSTTPLYGQSVTALLPDATTPNVIYAAVSAGELGSFSQCNDFPTSQGCSRTGVVRGVFNPAETHNNPWTWTAVGNITSLGQNGGLDLVRASDGTFFASDFREGVFRHAGSASDCANWEPLKFKSWVPEPDGWYTYKIAYEPTENKLYVSAGNPYASFGTTPSAAETGVWESVDEPGPPVLGDVWHRIFLSTYVDGESITALLPDGPNTLFLTTQYPDLQARIPDPPPPDPLPRGGVYKGEKIGGNWTFTRVLPTMDVSGIAISPFDSNILYAFAGQACCSSLEPIAGQDPGIWKSVDSGKSGTWTQLANNGLSHLKHGRLTFSKNDPKLLYATTWGGGLYEGTISCTDPVRDFECAARLNASSPSISGTITSGTIADLGSGSLDDTYQVLTESGTATKKKLTAVWTFTGASTGVTYKLRAEGKRTAGGMAAADDFRFSVATRISGACNGSESYGPTVVTFLSATDDDTVKQGNAGVLPTGSTVFCVKVVDSAPTGDGQADSLSLDRIYLMPLQATVSAAEGFPPMGGVGSVVSGSYINTQAPDELPTEATETLKEGPSGSNSSALTYYFRFDNVPSGSAYRLHFKGSRPNNADGDNFKFQWATSPTGTGTDISGAVISQAAEIPGGTDSGTFTPGGSPTTLYIFVKDTNSQTNKNSLDTVTIDHLAILVVP